MVSKFQSLTPTRKRIAFLGRGVHTIPSYRDLLNRLAKDYEIIVYSEVQVDPAWLRLDSHYEFRYTKAMAFPRRIREIFFSIWIIREHLKIKFDLIHAHSTFPTGFAATILQKLFRIPAVVSLDGGEGITLPEVGFGDGGNVIRTAFNKWIINRAMVITTLTRFHCELIYKNLAIKREIKVVTRGVDIAKFQKSKDCKISWPVHFLSVGYLSPVKDPETLLKAFFLIQQRIDCRLTYIGKDYMNGEVRRMAIDMGISSKVNFIEHMDYNQLSAYYTDADILLHTSRYESQGMVIGEAMASGLLICGTDVGLMSDLSGECCLTVQPGDAEGLAVTVLDLLSNEGKMNSLRTNAYQWSLINNLDQTVADFSSIYSQLLNTRASKE